MSPTSKESKSAERRLVGGLWSAILLVAAAVSAISTLIDNINIEYSNGNELTLFTANDIPRSNEFPFINEILFDDGLMMDDGVRWDELVRS